MAGSADVVTCTVFGVGADAPTIAAKVKVVGDKVKVAAATTFRRTGTSTGLALGGVIVTVPSSISSARSELPLTVLPMMAIVPEA